MSCLITLLDNTFIGTLFAGVTLALLGLVIYRYQKQLDIQYEDRRKIREMAALLLANIEISFKKYEAQLGMHDGKNPLLNNLNTLLNEKFSNYFKNKYIEEFNNIISKLNETNDTLIAHLKIRGNYDSEITILTEKIPAYSMFLASVSILQNSSHEDIESYRTGILEASSTLRNTLQKMIKGLLIK